MRWRTRQQHQHYVRMTEYLRDLPQYLSLNQRIKAAFMDYSGFSEAQALHVATLGQRPLFQVDMIAINGQRVTANGSHYRGLITIDVDIGNEMENQTFLGEGSARVLLYATCLHELVHFGREQNGLPVTINGDEAGKIFECRAYQGDINWDGSSSTLTQSRSGRYQGVPWRCPLSALYGSRSQLTWTPP